MSTSFSTLHPPLLAKNSMTENLTLDQVAKRVGRTSQTLRRHIRLGWLKAEKISGARGWRVKTKEAAKWADKYFGTQLETI